jgi:hypothetical protein
VLDIDSASLSCDLESFNAAYCGCTVLPNPCTFCFDGSSITEPDQVIDIPGIYGGGELFVTCQEMNDRFVGIPTDSRTCLGARSAFGEECGCPVYKDPCTMCEGGALLCKPKKEFEVTVGAG